MKIEFDIQPGKMTIYEEAHLVRLGAKELVGRCNQRCPYRLSVEEHNLGKVSVSGSIPVISSVDLFREFGEAHKMNGDGARMFGVYANPNHQVLIKAARISPAHRKLYEDEITSLNNSHTVGEIGLKYACVHQLHLPVLEMIGMFLDRSTGLFYGLQERALSVSHLRAAERKEMERTFADKTRHAGFEYDTELHADKLVYLGTPHKHTVLASDVSGFRSNGSR